MTLNLTTNWQDRMKYHWNLMHLIAHFFPWTSWCCVTYVFIAGIKYTWGISRSDTNDDIKLDNLMFIVWDQLDSWSPFH